MDDGEEIWFDVCCMEYGIRLFLARENGYTKKEGRCGDSY